MTKEIFISQVIDALQEFAKSEHQNEAQKKAESPAQDVRLKPYLTIPEVAEYLGVSRPTVYRLMRIGALPTVKIGACTRISSSALEDAIKNGFTTKYMRF